MILLLLANTTGSFCQKRTSAFISFFFPSIVWYHRLYLQPQNRFSVSPLLCHSPSFHPTFPFSRFFLLLNLIPLFTCLSFSPSSFLVCLIYLLSVIEMRFTYEVIIMFIVLFIFLNFTFRICKFHSMYFVLILF